jgi:hypothetical protein
MHYNSAYTRIDRTYSGAWWDGAWSGGGGRKGTKFTSARALISASPINLIALRRVGVNLIPRLFDNRTRGKTAHAIFLVYERETYCLLVISRLA